MSMKYQILKFWSKTVELDTYFGEQFINDYINAMIKKCYFKDNKSDSHKARLREFERSQSD